MRSVRISAHAIQRFRERVRPDLDALAAETLLAELVSSARARPTPRRWMRGCVSPSPGLRFLYPSTETRACLLLRGDTVVSVFSRSLVRSTGPERKPSPEHGRGRVERHARLTQERRSERRASRLGNIDRSW